MRSGSGGGVWVAVRWEWVWSGGGGEGALTDRLDRVRVSGGVGEGCMMC